MSKHLVTKHNALIGASYRLSLTEARVVIYSLSLINPLRSDFPLSYKINIANFSKMFNISHKDVYNDVKDAVLNKFWERDFSYRDNNGKTVVTRWLTKIIYKDSEGYLEIKFNEDLQPLLHQLKSNYTSYCIKRTSDFRSYYSIRLYEICLMWLNKNGSKNCFFFLKTSEMKEMLELDDKYTRFANFKARVLDVAQKEINKHSDIRIKYEIIKRGRSPFEIKFIVSKKAEKQKKEQENQPNNLEKIVGELTDIDLDISGIKDNMDKYKDHHTQEAMQSFQKKIADLSDKKLTLLALMGDETP